MSNKINAVITGVGGYVPDYVLTNEELSHMVNTDNEWIIARTGIKERRILTEEGLGTSYMARKATELLLKKTQVDPDSIDALIVATTTPDYIHPSTSSIVIGKIGLKNAFAFDLAGACCGFLYALDVASSLIQSGRYKHIVVIGADKMSSITDYEDRSTCALFGDGAGAVLMEGTTEENIGFVDSYLRTDGKGLPFLHVKAGGSVCPISQFSVDHRLHYTYQQGRYVFRYAVNAMKDDCQKVLGKHGQTVDDIDYLVCHQANLRIIDSVVNELQVPQEKVLTNIQNYGNTSAACMPLLLWNYERQLKKGTKLLFAAFGSGFVNGAALYNWAYNGESVAAK